VNGDPLFIDGVDLEVFAFVVVKALIGFTFVLVGAGCDSRNAELQRLIEQHGIEVPSTWSQTATNIVASKYFRGQVGSADRESSVKRLISRVVDTIVGWAETQGYFATADDSYKQNGYWWDAMVLGRYPDDAVKLYGPSMPAIRAGDMETIKQPLDFLGATLYSADPVRRGKDGKPEVIPWPVGYPITGFEWAVAPSILRLVPTWLHERYKLPIVVAENGLSVRDWVAADGGVHDPDRIDFMARYLRELAAAIAAGVPIEAYFHWSILDNFEWAEGYKHRFGLVHVNYETQKRTIKDSGKWYRDVIASNGKTVLATAAPDPRPY